MGYRWLYAALLFSIFFMAGCQGKYKEETDVSVEKIADQVMEEINKVYEKEGASVVYDRINFLDGDMGGQIAESMELDVSLIEEGVYLSNPVIISSDRIMIVKAKRTEDTGIIKESFENMKEQQISQWEHYLPEPYENVKNNLIYVSDRYVVYITYGDSKFIKTVIDDMIS
jgi:PBP1b-binding outer membrane lipoprotein LpoB